ncbi:MAG: helix-hairpin-helix domain-containing protein [bacterium]|nr:helix-hairpin-helix domain-containing protein [bacterium]
MERWFTPQERGVILFLVAILVFGSAIYVYKLKNPYFAPEYKISISKEDKAELHKLINETEVAIKSTKSMESPRAKVYSQEDSDRPLLNINTASKEELIELPGIGELYAQRIIEYREKHGGFKKVEELINVKGIGKKKFEELKDKLTVK